MSQNDGIQNGEGGEEPWSAQAEHSVRSPCLHLGEDEESGRRRSVPCGGKCDRCEEPCGVIFDVSWAESWVTDEEDSTDSGAEWEEDADEVGEDEEEGEIPEEAEAEVLNHYEYTLLYKRWTLKPGATAVYHSYTLWNDRSVLAPGLFCLILSHETLQSGK